MLRWEHFLFVEFVGGGGAIALGLELEGGVGDRDREVLAQAILQLGEDCGGIFHGEVFVNYHVGHQNRHAGGHRAGVEVMHGKHMRHCLPDVRVPYRGQVHPVFPPAAP